MNLFPLCACLGNIALIRDTDSSQAIFGCVMLVHALYSVCMNCPA